MFRYTIEQLKRYSDEKMISCIATERKENLTNMYSPLARRLSSLYERFYELSIHDEKVISLHFVEETLQNYPSKLKGTDVSAIMRILKEGLQDKNTRC